MNNREKVVIVGAGMAGLTASAYLAKSGYEVLLLEKNNRTGGLLGTFEKEGFSFDSGPRALVNSGIVKPVLKELGIEWNFLPNQISIGIEDQLFQVKSIKDLEEYKRILIELYPQDQQDIDKIIKSINDLSEYTRVLYEFDNPYFGDAFSDKQYVVKKLLPWTFKFLKSLRKFDQFNMPMEEYLSRLTKNQSIIDILIQHFFKKTPTYFALGYFYVYLDYFYPQGGTSVLKDLMVKKVEQWGGKIELNKQVTRVVPSAAKVVDAEGAEYHYDHLIWAADLKTLYLNLDPIGLEDMTTARVESEKDRILASKGSESVFIMCLGVNRPPSYFKERGGEHFFYTPSRKGLGEVNHSLRLHLIEHFDEYSKAEVLHWLDQYLDLNTYEISIPVLRDPALAPQGQTGVMASCLFDYEVMKKVEAAGWYDEFKEHIENRVLSLLSSSIYEGLSKDILFKFSSTPLTINKFSGSSEGAITGWSFETEPPVVYKLTDMSKTVFTAMPNVYKAGQWAYVPAGVPIAMLTAWHVYQKIIKQSKRKRK